MPLTLVQANDSYILGAMGLFLDRNVKAAYDAAATASATAPIAQQQYTTKMTILNGKPDDISIVRQAPSIAVSFAAAKASTQYGIGEPTMCRYRNFLLSCFPGLDANGAPCQAALATLRSLMQNAFETVAIKVPDYSNVSYSSSARIWCSDVMNIDHAGPPLERGSTTTLAQEKHRFDVHVSVWYAIQAQLAT